MTNILQKVLTIDDKRIIFFHPENDDTIFGTISCLREKKFHLEDVVFNKDDVIIDLGCNIGLVSLVLAAFNPDVKIYSFDAGKVAVDCLRAAAAINSFTNIQVFHNAVGVENKQVNFYSNGKDVSCLVGEGFNDTNKVLEETIHQISIDTIFDSELFDIQRVKYLKMDIEGAEFSIFDHLFEKRNDILDRIDYLHLEIHPRVELNPIELKNRVSEKFGNRVFFDT